MGRLLVAAAAALTIGAFGGGSAAVAKAPAKGSYTCMNGAFSSGILEILSKKKYRVNDDTGKYKTKKSRLKFKTGPYRTAYYGVYKAKSEVIEMHGLKSGTWLMTCYKQKK